MTSYDTLNEAAKKYVDRQRDDLARQKDALIRVAFERLRKAKTIEQCLNERRLKCVVREGVETYLCDEAPFLEIQPLRASFVHGEMSMQFDARCLGEAAK